MLARGWLAYPVTSMHSQLPPKSGCICQHIPRFANNLYNRSSAVDSLIQQPTPGRQANLGLRLSNRPSTVAIRHHHRIAPPGAMYHKKNRRRAVSYVSTGLACLPREANASPIYRRRAVVENTPEGGIVRHRTLRSVFLNEAASPQPILAYLSNIVLPTYHQ